MPAESHMADRLPEYCLLWIDHWSTCLTKGEWASWAQAVFSVLAIGASVGIVLWQHHRDRREQARRVAEADLRVVDDVSQCLTHLLKWVASAEALQRDLATRPGAVLLASVQGVAAPLSQAVAVVLETPLREVPAGLRFGFAMARDSAAELSAKTKDLEHVVASAGSTGIHPRLMEHWTHSLRDARSKLAGVADGFGRLQSELSARVGTP